MREKIDLARIRRLLSRYKYVVLVVCLGVLLMLLPTGSGGSTGETEPQAETVTVSFFDLDALEERLAAALSEIDGVGEVTVMLTLSSSGEEILAQDTSEGSSTETETVIVDTGDGEEAVSVKTIYPEFQGALIVCDGAGDSSVKWAVLQAVSAVTGLRSDQISICQRK